jgi:glycosyltransferase involved in cell wall biosynthesis
MRVAFVTHQFFPAFYTGVERLTLNLASQLEERGHECVVLTAARSSSGTETPYTWSGVRVRPVKARRPDRERPWRNDGRLARRLHDTLAEEEVDVVHVMHPMRLPQAQAAAQSLGLPVVAHIADFFYLCPRIVLVQCGGGQCPTASEGHACVSACGVRPGRERFARSVTQLAEADAVISPCRATIERHAAEGFSTEEWRHIPWGVDYALHPERLPAPATTTLRIGFLGTLLRHKGPHVLIKALRLLRGRPVELVLYGDSFHETSYEKELRAMAKDDPRIRFAGAYAHAELADVLAPLDLVAVPSLWHENLPSAGLNAIAAGVPLVTSDVPGLRELVEDYACGLTFPCGDAPALAELLERLLEDPGLLAVLRRTMVPPPSLEDEAAQVEAAYRAVCGAVA